MSSTSFPKKTSFRSRVGTVMRRSSTAFSIPGRSGYATPPLPDSDIASIAGSISGKDEREESTSSLNKVQPPSASFLSSPSPIPESPTRESTALLPDSASSTSPKEHSLLAAQVVTTESQSARRQTPPSSEPSVSQPAAEDAQQPFALLAPKDAQLIPSATIHKESDRSISSNALTMSSTSPRKIPSFRSRVGTVMRRSSTAFSIPGRSGSATPPPPDSNTASIADSISGKDARQESTSSLNKLQPPPSPVLSSPSPIPESPARESAPLLSDSASSTSPKEHSPLAVQVVATEPQSARSQIPPSSEPSVSQPAAEDAQQPSELLAPKDVQPIPSVTVHKESDRSISSNALTMSSTSARKKSTFRSRIGTVMRRSPTAFTIPGLPRSATPPPPDSDTASIAGSISGKDKREESTSSLNKVQPPSASFLSSPSPIPESPMREPAALLPDSASSTSPKEHSPLAAQIVMTESQSARSQSPPSSEPSVSQPAAEDVQQPSELLAPTDVQPIPSVTTHKESDSKLDVATVLTEEPDELPVTEPQPQPQPPAPESVPASNPSTPPARVSLPPSAPATPAVRVPVQPSVPSTPAARGPSAQSTPPTQPTTSSFGYFDIQRGSTNADGENPANVWADHAHSSQVTLSASSSSGSEVRP
ncbi:hypothetical protein ID866_8162 [Astraeus odoratus]|nr:hypothetical protein ID866_8162 [Astraeus odoratus]